MFFIAYLCKSGTCVVVAFSVLISDLNISVWPRISHFCVILCLVALIINTYIKNNLQMFGIYHFMFSLCVCTSLEFYLSFVLMCIVTLISIYYYRETMGKRYYLSFGWCYNTPCIAYNIPISVK